MDIPESSVLEIWEMFVEHLPASKRTDLALRFIKHLIEHDVELDDLDDIRGEDEHIDHALDVLGSEDDDYEAEDRYEE